jgi:hypothetical protein
MFFLTEILNEIFLRQMRQGCICTLKIEGLHVIQCLSSACETSWRPNYIHTGSTSWLLAIDDILVLDETRDTILGSLPCIRELKNVQTPLTKASYFRGRGMDG